MSKRELGLSNSALAVEGPRVKRRKETAATTSDLDVSMSDPIAPGAEQNGQAGGEGDDVVKEQGLKLWQIVKDAINKEGRNLSLDFLRRPSKRQYPDYYQLVQRPIALDDIKKQLDTGAYHTFESVRQDFELCFNNAKQYNVKNSDIWKDAKDLLKVVHKTYNKMTPTDDSGGNPDGDGSKKGKTKPPNMNRMIKSRLQKLVDKTDDSGRVLSTEFMELPSKKEWPSYYKEIKRPQCIENIFKHIRRKEYLGSAEFAADVELVFSNAMTFNQDHTNIWEDARILRNYFRQLMSDLPPPYSLPEYTKPSNGKIKIKMPVAAHPLASASSPPTGQPHPQAATSSSSLVLRVPGTNASSNSKTVPQPVSTSALAQTSLPTSIPVPTPPPAPSLAVPPTETRPSSTTPQSTNQSAPYINATFSHHYPNASYQPPITTPVATTPSSSTPHPPMNSLTNPQATHSLSNSPAPPPLHPNHQLKAVSLTTEPRGRPLNLDYRDGVKSWAMRLGLEERAMCVADVTFMGDEEDESSGGEEDEEKEEEEEEMEVEVPVKNGKKKGKGRGRGRPRGTTKAVVAAKVVRSVKKKAPKLGEIEVKVNGVVIKEKADHGGEWAVDIPVGSNVLEVGEKGGLIWKVYTERMADF